VTSLIVCDQNMGFVRAKTHHPRGFDAVARVLCEDWLESGPPFRPRHRNPSDVSLLITISFSSGDRIGE
jgi:hypothetical protein